MSQPRDDRQDDLFRPALQDIINLRHPLVRLAVGIDWGFLAGWFGLVCCAGPGQPPLPTRLVAGLFILKHMDNLSDEMLCDRWVENPYFQYFCGEVVFRHEAPFDRWLNGCDSDWARSRLPRCCRRAFRWRIGRGRSRASISSAWWWTPPCRRRRLASDRCAAHPPGDREARRDGQTRGRRGTPESSARGQTRGHHGGA